MGVTATSTLELRQLFYCSRKPFDQVHIAAAVLVGSPLRYSLPG